MNKLDQANETLSKAKEVRIVLLPPFTVASYQCVGGNPEEEAALCYGQKGYVNYSKHNIIDFFRANDTILTRFGVNKLRLLTLQAMLVYLVWLVVYLSARL